jgi:hypothetical protein
MGFSLKLLFAAISGFLVSLTWSGAAELGFEFDVVVIYGLLGSLFAAGVLLPYLKREDLRSWRPLALVLVSAVSIYGALYTAGEWNSGKWGPDLEDFVVASIVGAGVVLLPSPYILGLRYSLKYLALGILAAVVGGVLFHVLGGIAYSFYLTFGLWHVAICVALHYSNPTAAQGRWLANTKRSMVFMVTGVFALIAVAPVVDDGIGALIRSHYADNNTAFLPDEQISAYGIRDERKIANSSWVCKYGCLGLIQDGTYAFQEYAVDDARGAYQLFYVADRPDDNCHAYGRDWTLPAGVSIQRSVKISDDRCLSYRFVDKALAEYAIRDRYETIHAGFGLYPLSKTSRQIVRLNDDTTVAAISYYVYHSRITEHSIGKVEPWKEYLQKVLPLAGEDWQPPPP